MDHQDVETAVAKTERTGTGNEVTIGDKGRVTLPEGVRKHLGVQEGDHLMVELHENGTVELIPAALIPRDQLWFAHPEMQERVDEAMRDVATGRTTRVQSRKELRATLAALKQAGRHD